jgi:hypothetical protein
MRHSSPDDRPALPQASGGTMKVHVHDKWSICMRP